MPARAAEVQVYMIKTPVIATRGFFRDTIEKSQVKKKNETIEPNCFAPHAVTRGEMT